MIHIGNCLDILPTFDAESFDAVVTDPPYNLVEPRSGGDAARGRSTGVMWTPRSDEAKAKRRGGFMGKSWDGTGVAFDPETWRAVFRVMKPGARLLAFGGTRTHHRMVCAIEDAGFVVEDTVMWLYGCLSDDTEILIDGRWEPYHKATKGRLALCYNAHDDTYSWQPIQETFRYDIRDTAYRIESDSTDQLVSRNHRCLVERGGTYVFERGETLALQPQIRVPVLEGLPQLLHDLPVPHDRTGNAKQGMLSRVLHCLDLWGTEAETAVRAVGVGLSRLCGVRGGNMEAASMGQAQQGRLLLAPLPREGIRQGMGEARPQRTRRLDGEVRDLIPSQDERGEQPRVEGWRHLLQDARQLYRRPLRALSGRVHLDGTQGRLRDGTSAGGSSNHWAPASSLRGCPPQGPQAGEQRSLQSATVRQQSGPQTIRASRYTRADLATIRPVPYRGIVWCVRVPTGAFVARRNGKVFVTGNSGFPKHKSKLKPAFEPICVAWKPDKRATPLNIDQCRITTSQGAVRSSLGDSTSYTSPWHEVARILRTVSTHTAPSSGVSLAPDGLRLANAVADVLDCRELPDSRVDYPTCSCCDGGRARLVEEGARASFQLPRDAPVLHALRWIEQRIPDCRCADHPSTWDGLIQLVAAAAEDSCLPYGTVYHSYVENTARVSGVNSTVYGADNRRGMIRGGSALGRWPANVVLSHTEGCREVGTRRVKGTNKPTRRGNPSEGWGFAATDAIQDYTDPDGYETVAAWDCAPDCPIFLLDAQSGERKSGGRAGVAYDTGCATTEGWGNIGKGGSGRCISDTGGASRYFATFPPDTLVDCWDSSCDNSVSEETDRCNETASTAETSSPPSPTTFSAGSDASVPATADAPDSARTAKSMLGATSGPAMGVGIASGANPEAGSCTSNLNLVGHGNRQTALSPPDTKSTTETLTQLTTDSTTSNAFRSDGTTITTSESGRITESLTASKNDGASDAASTSPSAGSASEAKEPTRATANPALLPTSASGAGAKPTDPRFYATFPPDDEATRMFYCPKSSRRERNAGLEGMPEKESRRFGDRAQGPLPQQTPQGAIRMQNVHPTVKPIALMSWLVRLVSPPGGLVLDPFAGSGSTGCAAALLGLEFVGIEMDEEYAEIARRRIAHWASKRIAAGSAPRQLAMVAD